MSPIKTNISQVFADRILVRGYNIVDLAGCISFGEMIYLLMTGELPQGQEGRLIEAMLIVACEHGVEAPSAFVARAVANCGVPVQSAIAAGISACGENHGGAGEAFARILGDALAAAAPGASLEEIAAQVVTQFRQSGRRIPGVGHRKHDPDPRAVRLLALAKGWGLAGRHTALAEAIVDSLAAASGTRRGLNVDGALACLLADIGVNWHYAKALFVIARTAGLSAQVVEEMETGKPFKFIQPAELEYSGPAERSFNP